MIISGRHEADAVEVVSAELGDDLACGSLEVVSVSRGRGGGNPCVGAGLPRAVSQPDDLKAPHQNPYGVPDLPDKALGGTTMGLHHKLGYVLGGKYHLPHAGVHHSALLPQVAAFNAPAGAGALGRAARALGVRGPEAVGPALFDLADQLRAPTSPADLGPGGRRHRGGRRDRLHSLYLESADLYAARSITY